MPNAKKMDYVVLGMLKHKSLTGYELKKCFDASVGIFWSASFGSIYPTLSALEKSGFVVRSENVQSTSQRESITYRITDSGRECLRDWVKTPVDKNEMRCETLLKLFFCDTDNPETALAHIEKYENDLKSKLADLNIAIGTLSNMNDDNHLYILLSAEYGIQMYNGLLDWCVHARDEITKMKRRKSIEK